MNPVPDIIKLGTYDLKIFLAFLFTSFSLSAFAQRIDVDKVRKLQKQKQEKAIVDEAEVRKRAAEKLEQDKLREAIGLGRIRYCTILPFAYKANQELVSSVLLSLEKFSEKYCLPISYRQCTL